MSSIRALKKIKDHTDHLHFARDEIASWVVHQLEATPGESHRVLDLGLGAGLDLIKVRDLARKRDVPVDLFGVESQEDLVRQAGENGITTYPLNLEKDALPAEDEFFDAVIANHVIEHVKEIFWIFSEISRVVKKGGLVIIGVPNLASWHNRVALLFGRQPPCIRLIGPHLRGITKSGFKDFVENEGYFELIETKGSNFYPFPETLNRAFARLLPTMAASIHFVMRRTDKEGLFIDTLDSEPCVFQAVKNTPYYRGPKED